MSDDRSSGGERLPLISLLAAGDGVLLAGLGIGLAQAGVTAPIVGFGLAVFGVVPAMFAVGLAGWAIRKSRGGPMARAGLTMGAVQTVVTVAMGISAFGAPNINDISTDLADPPELTSDGGTIAPYPTAFAAIQRAEYPGVGPLTVGAPVDEVRAAVLAAAEAAGWDVLEIGDAGNRLRATAVTGVFKFVDDIVVRVTPRDGQTRIDVRSRSRVGRNDLGTNAARIQDYLEDVRLRLTG